VEFPDGGLHLSPIQQVFATFEGDDIKARLRPLKALENLFSLGKPVKA